MNDWLARLETALRKNPLNQEPLMNEPHTLVGVPTSRRRGIHLPAGGTDGRLTRAPQSP